MQKTREIRQILLGKTTTEDGVVRRTHAGEIPDTLGGSNGSLSVLLLGFVGQDRIFFLPRDCDPVEVTQDALLAVGMPTYLEESPEAAGSLRRTGLAETVLFAAELEDRRLTVTAYTGRGVTAVMRLNSALHSFEQKLPEGTSARRLPSEGSLRRRARDARWAKKLFGKELPGYGKSSKASKHSGKSKKKKK